MHVQYARITWQLIGQYVSQRVCGKAGELACLAVVRTNGPCASQLVCAMPLDHQSWLSLFGVGIL